MSIETKNYGQIVYRNPFHYVPARYIKNDTLSGSGAIKPSLAEVKKLLAEKKTESDQKIVADTWTVDNTKEGEEKWNKALDDVITYFDKKIGK